jgi:hypothetical protein
MLPLKRLWWPRSRHLVIIKGNVTLIGLRYCLLLLYIVSNLYLNFLAFQGKILTTVTSRKRSVANVRKEWKAAASYFLVLTFKGSLETLTGTWVNIWSIKIRLNEKFVYWAIHQIGLIGRSSDSSLFLFVQVFSLDIFNQGKYFFFIAHCSSF